MKKFESALFLVLAAMVHVTPAAAYCRAMSCELGEERRVANHGTPCKRDAEGCVTDGNPLHWSSPCLTYAVQRDGSPAAGIDAEAFQKLVAQGFAAWQGASCPGGGSPRFEARFQGVVACDHPEYVCGTEEQNVNVMMFHDTGWPSDGRGDIGLTHPIGGTSTGLVVDADMELNSEDFDFSAGASGPLALDLSQVLAHEIGHFLGLGHSTVRGALMSKDYGSLQLSRELLTEDDIAAICAVYPPGAALSCPAPPPPAYDQCQRTPGDDPSCTLGSMTHDRNSGGCSISQGAPGAPARASLLVLFAGSLLLNLKRRAAKRAAKRSSAPLVQTQ